MTIIIIIIIVIIIQFLLHTYTRKMYYFSPFQQK